MTKKEFEKLVGKEVDDFEYTLIETVYTWYPTISNTNGKQEIATLYSIGGIRLIKDMYATAMAAQSIMNERRKANAQLEYISTQYESLRKGYDVDKRWY